LRIQREVMREQAQREFNQAMADVQTEMGQVLKDATNTHTGSAYARLESIDREIRPVYTRHGFSVRFGSEPSPHEGWIRITCTVSHRGGYSETNHLDAPPDSAGSQGRSNKTPVQAVGSSVSYLRRYLTVMVFNIVLAGLDDDDDGNGGAPGRTQRATYQRPAPAQAKPAGLKLTLLNEKDGGKWLKNLEGLLKECASLSEVQQIATHYSVREVLKLDSTAPTMIRRNVQDFLRDAHERLAEPPPDDTTTEKQDESAPGFADPVAELIAEVDAIDNLPTLDRLKTDATWRARVKQVCADFPPDEDRINEAIEARRATLKDAKP
jgi:hypothetical protein